MKTYSIHILVIFFLFSCTSAIEENENLNLNNIQPIDQITEKENAVEMSENPECDPYSCQSCNSIGGYAQITTGTPSHLVFQAYTFIQGSNPYCPCYADLNGTVKFEYEIEEYPSGISISEGSVTQNVDFQTVGHCGFEFRGTTINNVFNYPHPGGDVLVRLKTTHQVNGTAGPTHTYQTWGVR